MITRAFNGGGAANHENGVFQMADEKTFTQADIDAAVKKATDKAAEDTKGLKAKVDELLDESKAAKAKAKEAEEAAAAAAEKAAKEGGDVEALTASFEAKIAKINEAHEAEKSELANALRSSTAEARATSVAAELAIDGFERHLQRDILDRLRTEVVDGKVKETILDKDGKPSAMSMDDLKAEMRSDPANKALIRASNASGGGAPNKGDGGAGSLKRSEMSKSDRAEYIKENGQEAYLALAK